MPGRLRLVPPQARVEALKEGYRSMSMMIFRRLLTFGHVLETLSQLEREVNSVARRLVPGRAGDSVAES